MARIRQQNVTAAQWSSNGGAIGTVDLTQPENDVFGVETAAGDPPRELVGGIEMRQREPLESPAARIVFQHRKVRARMELHSPHDPPDRRDIPGPRTKFLRN